MMMTTWVEKASCELMAEFGLTDKAICSAHGVASVEEFWAEFDAAHLRLQALINTRVVRSPEALALSKGPGRMTQVLNMGFAGLSPQDQRVLNTGDKIRQAGALDQMVQIGVEGASGPPKPEDLNFRVSIEPRTPFVPLREGEDDTAQKRLLSAVVVEVLGHRGDFEKFMMGEATPEDLEPVKGWSIQADGQRLPAIKCAEAFWISGLAATRGAEV